MMREGTEYQCITIVVPTLNSQRFVKRCIDSVLAQTYHNIEVFVVDGGSTDGTLDIISSYSDSRLHYISERDSGVYGAMNKGILRSHGEWLYFLGSDDYLYGKDVLSSVFCREGVCGMDVIYGEVEAPQLPAHHKGEWTDDKIMHNICHQCIFYKRWLFSKFGLYDDKLKVSGDYDFNLKWRLSKSVNYEHIDITIAHYSSGGLSEQIQDIAFKSSLKETILKRGFFSLSHEVKIELAIDIKNRKKTENHFFCYWIIRIALAVDRMARKCFIVR